jgi:hypothetical protein
VYNKIDNIFHKCQTFSFLLLYFVLHSRDLTNLRWVIGTGNALTTLPGGAEVIRESLMHCGSITFPEAGFPILIDQDNILTSLGAFSGIYPHAAWQLLLESLGVDS